MHIDLNKTSPDWELIKFPDNSLKFKLKRKIRNKEIISISLHNNDDLILLGLTVHTLKQGGATNISVLIKYMMYQQDDRLFNENESFGLKNICSILNTYPVDMYYVYHPHSDKVEFLNNVRIIGSDQFFKSVLFGFKNDPPLWVIPDAGAFKTQVKQMSEIGYKGSFISCSKSRNPETGELTQVIVCDDLEGKDVIIFDDICLGGRTFIGIFNILKEKNCGKVYLAISHGLFNQGLEHLKVFDKIFTTDSICQLQSNELLEVFPIQIGPTGKQITILI